MMANRILVTGGAGFIGSNLVHYLLQESDAEILVVDKLTYAGNLHSLGDIQSHSKFQFEKLDLASLAEIEKAIDLFQPQWILHLAAESHVDRSIDSPSQFVQSNIVGTYNLLTAARKFYLSLSEKQQNQFRFVHVSTDEVYGSLAFSDQPFTEASPYAPRSPYSASKASADHLVRAWHDTYQFPTIITNCSNNFGPFQHPEKLIPLVVLKAIHGDPIPIYGNGQNIRDWLFVLDHVKALCCIAKSGKVGQTYLVGAQNEWTNRDIVQSICEILDHRLPIKQNDRRGQFSKDINHSYSELIEFVADRPGHDFRYAVDASKLKQELAWTPEQNFETGLQLTVQWYLDNPHWWAPLFDESQLRRRGLCDS